MLLGIITLLTAVILGQLWIRFAINKEDNWQLVACIDALFFILAHYTLGPYL